MKLLKTFINESIKLVGLSLLNETKEINKEEALWILNHPKNWYVHLSYSEQFPANTDRKHSVYSSINSKIPTSTTKPKLGYFLWPLDVEKERNQIKSLIIRDNKDTKNSAFSNRPYIHFILLQSERILDLQNLTENEYNECLTKLEENKTNKLYSNLKIADKDLFNKIELPDTNHLNISNKKHKIFGSALSNILDQYFYLEEHQPNYYTNTILNRKDFKIGLSGVSRQQILFRFLDKNEKNYLGNYIFSFIQNDKLLTKELESKIMYDDEILPEEVQDKFKKFLNSDNLIAKKINLEKTLNNIERYLEVNNDKLPGNELNIEAYIQDYIKNKEKLDNISWNDSYGLKLWALIMALSNDEHEWFNIMRNVLHYDIILDKANDGNGIVTPFDYEIIGSGREGDLNREKVLTSFSNENNQAILLNLNSIKKNIYYYNEK